MAIENKEFKTEAYARFATVSAKYNAKQRALIMDFIEDVTREAPATVGNEAPKAETPKVEETTKSAIKW